MSTTRTISHLHCGDCREVMRGFADARFHAVVTDPPYELGFMGRKWDSSGIAYDLAVWRECLRVLKPGGWLLAFGGSRTYHRLACAIEDAGFEVRDMIEWLYGSGFPKSHDVSKAIDRELGCVREVVGTAYRKNDRDATSVKLGRVSDDYSLTAPASAEAKAWQGWGTALKPAHEPICVARKPLEGTVAQNVLTHGAGGLHIDAGRIGVEERFSSPATPKKGTFNASFSAGYAGKTVQRRWPANVALDEEAAAALDAHSGELTSNSGNLQFTNRKQGVAFGKFDPCETKGISDTGGASRFFYTAKASGADRGNHVKGEMPLFGVGEEAFRNTHPTVKPVKLMEWLLKLVTPPGGRVLDPFAGSGTTLVAARGLGIECEGIELLEEHCAIIRERLSTAKRAKGAEEISQ